MGITIDKVIRYKDDWDKDYQHSETLRRIREVIKNEIG